MARLRAYLGLSMVATPSGDEAVLKFADDREIVIQDGPFETHYTGSFHYSDGNVSGIVRSMVQFNDATEAWHLSGLTLDTRYLIMGGYAADREAFAGDDRMVGSRQADTLIGYAGNDRMLGGPGADNLKGYSGNDGLFGQSGNDRLSGGGGSDELAAGAGDDRLYGGDGNDQLFGHSGKDSLTGGAGDDKMTGGSGADEFRFGKASGHDVIVDFASDDHIRIESGASLFSQLHVAQDGLDVVIAFADTEVRLLYTQLHSVDAHDFLF